MKPEVKNNRTENPKTEQQDSLNPQIRSAFGSVACSDGLKEHTVSYVLNQMDRQRNAIPARTFTPARMKLAVSLACLVFFVGSGFGGYQLYYTEAATISIDVNPSIELGINRWGKVVDETSYGKASEDILSSISLKHMEYEDALKLLLASEAMDKYLKGNSLVSITVDNRTDNEQLMSNLQECVDNTLKQCHDGVTAEYASVDEHMCREAHSQGMSVGKYNAILELLETDPNATVDEFRDKSMKEIKGHMEECRHGVKTGDEGNDTDRCGGGQRNDCHEKHHGHEVR